MNAPIMHVIFSSFLWNFPYPDFPFMLFLLFEKKILQSCSSCSTFSLFLPPSLLLLLLHVLVLETLYTEVQSGYAAVWLRNSCLDRATAFPGVPSMDLAMALFISIYQGACIFAYKLPCITQITQVFFYHKLAWQYKNIKKRTMPRLSSLRGSGLATCS